MFLPHLTLVVAAFNIQLHVTDYPATGYRTMAECETRARYLAEQIGRLPVTIQITDIRCISNGRGA